MSSITFEISPYRIDAWTIIQLPKSASAKLPSRGMTMIDGTINETNFQAPLEPDGKGSHWFRLEEDLLATTGISEGDTVTLEIEPMKVWPRPELPDDVKNALAKVPEAQKLWTEITPKAQWEWIRWIRATNKAETRQRHIEVACSKLMSGMRRPCCFNSNTCTEPYVSKNGALLEPAQMAK